MDFLRPLAGGALIGLSAILLLLAEGKIAGISGILGGALDKRYAWNDWRYGFLAGLLAGGLALLLAGFEIFSPLPGRSIGALLAAGLLVGYGTQLGSGCTSGHGVCGLGRLSYRSFAATLTFIAAGAVTVFVVEHLLGGLI